MMKDYREHHKNIMIIRAMLMVFLLSLMVLLFGGCTILSKSRGKKENSNSQTEVENTLSTTETNSKGSFFDKSRIYTNDWSFEIEPIDPQKPFSHWVDKSGNARYENARPIWKNTDRTEEVDKGGTEETTEETTDQANSESNTENKESESWYEKMKVSVPWYFWFFLGLFGTLFFIIVRVSRKLDRLLPNENS